MARLADITDRAAQDDLLQLRNDVMTVQREISAQDPRLFPLRYARVNPKRLGRAAERARQEAAPLETPTVLVIPDGPGAASVMPYDLLRRSLAAKGLDVIMVEHRGVGLSRLDGEGHDLPPHAMDIREVIEDLVAVLDHAQVAQTVVYGCGYGAVLALGLASQHPDRVASLVLDSPYSSPGDEAIGQRLLRELYWDGTDSRTDTIAAALRELDRRAVIDARRAGPVILAVHENGGIDDVRELVDLLAVGRGQLTWASLWQALTQDWVQSTRYINEPDLVAPLARAALGMGAHADGGPLDPLVLSGEGSGRGGRDPGPAGSEPARLPAGDSRAAIPTTESAEGFDLEPLLGRITAPTLVLVGERDLVTPPEVARRIAEAIPGAQLIEVSGTGHGLLDTHSQLAQIAMLWSAAGAQSALVERAEALQDLPPTPTAWALSRGLRLALAAERFSPWRLRWESARTRRAEARLDPTARRAGKGPRL